MTVDSLKVMNNPWTEATAFPEISESADVYTAENAAAAFAPQAPVAAADLSVSPGSSVNSLPSGESDPPVMLDCLPGENHIGEIFIGADKLEPIEMWFENTAYTVNDELLFDVLEVMNSRVNPPGLTELPYGIDDTLFELPLFLQRAG